MGARHSRRSVTSIRLHNTTPSLFDTVFFNEVNDIEFLELGIAIQNSLAEMPLPVGWEQGSTSKGCTYFIDHTNKTTTFHDPRLPDNRTKKEKKKNKPPKYELNFYSRCQQFRALVKKYQDQGEFVINISRKNLLEDSISLLKNLDPANMKKRLIIKYEGEKGLDYGGMSREWFLELGKELIKPSNGLFQPRGQDFYTIDPSSINLPNYKEMFRVVGFFLGMAIYHGKILPINFELSFFKSLLGISIELADMKYLDEQVYKNLKYILENNCTADLDLNFTIAEYETSIHNLDSNANDNDHSASEISLITTETEKKDSHETFILSSEKDDKHFNFDKFSSINYEDNINKYMPDSRKNQENIDNINKSEIYESHSSSSSISTSIKNDKEISVYNNINNNQKVNESNILNNKSDNDYNIKHNSTKGDLEIQEFSIYNNDNYLSNNPEINNDNENELIENRVFIQGENINNYKEYNSIDERKDEGLIKENKINNDERKNGYNQNEEDLIKDDDKQAEKENPISSNGEDDIEIDRNTSYFPDKEKKNDLSFQKNNSSQLNVIGSNIEDLSQRLPDLENEYNFSKNSIANLQFVSTPNSIFLKDYTNRSKRNSESEKEIPSRSLFSGLHRRQYSDQNNLRSKKKDIKPIKNKRNLKIEKKSEDGLIKIENADDNDIFHDRNDKLMRKCHKKSKNKKDMNILRKNNIKCKNEEPTDENSMINKKSNISVRIIELKENGENIAVTEDNKNEYVELILNHHFGRNKEQINIIREAMSTFIPLEVFGKFFTPKEFSVMIGGSGNVKIDDMRKWCEYSGWNSSSPQVIWLWEILKDFSQEELRLFLKFITGTNRVPVGGFQHLYGSSGPRRLTINKSSRKNGLPVTHSCFNRIDLPEYDDRETMRRNLLYAIKESHGFELE